MRELRRALAERKPKKAKAKRRVWVYVAYDQLTSEIGPLARIDPEDAGIVLVENPAKPARRGYHKQKLAWVLASQRHFAIEQAARGVDVRYVVDDDYAQAAMRVARDVGQPLVAMTPAERELRHDLAPALASGALSFVPHEGWLTTREDFVTSHASRQRGAPPWRMDTFYRYVRRRTGILMDGDKPLGGKLSFDAENRKPWHGEPPAPQRPTFEVDAITREVGELVATRFAKHWGELHLERIAATREDARRVWRFAREKCLPWFGPFEDAMSTRSRELFHTLLSPLLNLSRLTPAEVIEDVVGDPRIPHASAEGFVRQILGWRELVRHVHEATDGFRTIPEGANGSPNVLGANRPLPPAYWGKRTGLHCLDQVVEAVWQDGYSHHISRLMILSSLATMLDVSPRELTDWFWVAYIDAFDWVVEPNVLAMGTFGTGDLMTTKPYVSGAAYIDRMSDYCGDCSFDPKKTCPITPLYWAFLARHEDVLAENPRMLVPVRALAKRSAARRAEDARIFEDVSRALTRGEPLDAKLW